MKSPLRWLFLRLNSPGSQPALTEELVQALQHLGGPQNACVSLTGESRPGHSTTVLQENLCLFLSEKKKDSKGETFIVSKKQMEHSEMWGFSAWEVSALIPGGPRYHAVHNEGLKHSAFKRILLSSCLQSLHAFVNLLNHPASLGESGLPWQLY